MSPSEKPVHLCYLTRVACPCTHPPTPTEDSRRKTTTCQILFKAYPYLIISLESTLPGRAQILGCLPLPPKSLSLSPDSPMIWESPKGWTTPGSQVDSHKQVPSPNPHESNFFKLLVCVGLYLCTYGARRRIRCYTKHFITSQTASHVILTTDTLKSYLQLTNEETEACLRLYTN